jgi:hypothetical protein
LIRAVALSDEIVQAKVAKSFIPLKLAIPRGKDWPLGENWEVLDYWRITYNFLGQVLGGQDKKCGGFTGISVISSDLKVEYGNGGPGMIWEMFEAAQYDANKCAAMLDRSVERLAREREIRADKTLKPEERERKLASFREEFTRSVKKEGEAHPWPKGFSLEGAAKIYKIAEDPYK